MGSFINELAKGFVRSAVNQVGRDAGRVVSNNIYGDAHSIPHRNVSAGGAGRVSSVGKVEDEETVIIEPSEGKAIAWCVVALFFNFLGAVILLVVGYRKLKNKYVASAWLYESKAVYVADGRYKAGERYDGHQLSRRKIEVSADEFMIEKNEKIAKIYLYAGFAILICCLFVTIASI